MLNNACSMIHFTSSFKLQRITFEFRKNNFKTTILKISIFVLELLDDYVLVEVSKHHFTYENNASK